VTTPDQRTSAGSGGNPSWFGTGLNNFTLRIVSAAVLAPVVLLCAYVGGWVFLVLSAAAAAGVLWEWTRLVDASVDPRVLLPGLAALFAALLLTGFDQPSAAIATVVVAAVFAGGLVSIWPRPFPARNPPFWVAGGVVYSGVLFLAPALLRRDPDLGLTAVLFIAATVWATDIFAYLTGRSIGGPLLWPSVSPNKTWAGAIGGLIGGVAAATMVAYASGITKLAAVGLVAFVLSVLTQAGDLLESAVKRRFGAKDTSRLIPGHGGLMDRLDGFLVAAVAAALIGIVRQGTEAPAQGLLVW
jgi:phosphatidate cytidylyltransferase